MLKKLFLITLVSVLMILNLANVYVYVGAQEDPVAPIYEQLFEKILADPDLNTTDGTVREAESVCDPSIEGCFKWSNLNDGNPDSFSIEWAQVKKGDQACPEQGYAFSAIDKKGNTTCIPVDLCDVVTFSSKHYLSTATKYTYCAKPDYFLYIIGAGTLTATSGNGALICCKKWFVQ